MTRRYKILAGILIVFLGLLVYMEATKPEPVNWFESYSKIDRIPYGTYIFYESLKESRKDILKDVNTPPYEFIKDSSDVSGSYVFINSSVYFDEAESERLLSWVAQGNTLFVASAAVSQVFLDTLNLETKAYYDLDNFERNPLLELSNPSFSTSKPYAFDRTASTRYFSKIDTVNTLVLGVMDLEKEGVVGLEEPKVNFIKQGFGDGYIFLHLFPDAFTNYFMLHKDNLAYTNAANQYLPSEGKIYWDNHYKNGKTFNTSPLYMIFKNRYLKWAWYTLLMGVFLWVFFEGKRKQRAIPIISPLKNQTLEYTATIAGMYLDKAGHKSIATHQINHFLEYLRSNFQLDTSNLGLQFIGIAAAKTGHKTQETKKIIDYIVGISQKNTVTQEELMRLNTLIEAFKKN